MRTSYDTLNNVNYMKVITYFFLVIIYVPTFYKLFSYGWKQADYSHGPLILLAFLWLIWKKREFFVVTSDNKAHPVALSLLLFGLLLYAFGSIQRTIVLEAFSLIPVFIGTTGFLLGRDALRHIIFPAFFLVFLVPPPLFLIDMLTSPLKMMVASTSELLLRFAGYTISRNGAILFMGDYSIVVGDACSGIRSLISLMAVGTVYAYFQKISNIKKSVLFLSIIPISIIANIIRLVVLALITYYFGEAAGQGFFHNFSGILLFVIAMISLVILDTLLDRGSRNVDAD